MISNCVLRWSTRTSHSPAPDSIQSKDMGDSTTPGRRVLSGGIGQIGHSHGNLNQPLERTGVGGMNPQVSVFFGSRVRDIACLSGRTEPNPTVRQRPATPCIALFSQVRVLSDKSDIPGSSYTGLENPLSRVQHAVRHAENRKRENFQTTCNFGESCPICPILGLAAVRASARARG